MDRASTSRAIAAPRDRSGTAQAPAAPARWRWLALLAALGPGVLAMAGDNDAGGLLTYVATGSRFGPAFFVPVLVPLAALAFAVQEMAMRLTVASGRSFAALLAERVDRRWARLAAVDLAAQNWLMLLTEFAGMGLGLAHFGVPLGVGVGLSVVLVAALTLLPAYRLTERLGLVLAVLSILFLPLAVAVHPPAAAVRLWPRHPGPGFGLFALAAIGNALAPWMIFFAAQAVHERGTAAGGLRGARLDLAAGTVLQTAVAVAVLLVAAAVPAGGGLDAQAWLAGFSARVSPLAGDIFAIGIFDAGFVAAVTVSLSSAWAVLETFGQPRPVAAAGGAGRPAAAARPGDAGADRPASTHHLLALGGRPAGGRPGLPSPAHRPAGRRGLPSPAHRRGDAHGLPTLADHPTGGPGLPSPAERPAHVEPAPMAPRATGRISGAHRRAGFRAVYVAGLATAGAAVLLPGLPLAGIAVGAQAASALLMPPILVLLLVLANDRGLLGSLRNGRAANAAGLAAACAFSLAALTLLWVHGS